ncbi:MAG: hypothetical protein V7K26_00130 [Nostoc sp.]|uniref:hypothetical protein n=1 Tax=Nostoc sp. TaxID=1180 RepID=UPI002FF0EEA6
MNREEEVKAAIVVLPEEILFASPEENKASQAVAFHSHQLTEFVHTVDPELTRAEAISLTALIIKDALGHFKENPQLVTQLKQITEKVRRLRK